MKLLGSQATSIQDHFWLTSREVILFTNLLLYLATPSPLSITIWLYIFHRPILLFLSNRPLHNVTVYTTMPSHLSVPISLFVSCSPLLPVYQCLTDYHHSFHSSGYLTRGQLHILAGHCSLLISHITHGSGRETHW